ncbi:MAG: hypothetical protein M1830_002673 [Pleopsidium flavum]|nr:MAG: hypothetical protein M1830_002673 [Pleopsidium flavum]
MSRLEALPDELLNHVFEKLSEAEQYNTALTSWRCYHLIVPHLYRTVELKDCENPATRDQHDDTPIIRILLVLAKNAYLASKVQNLTHKCHYPLPDPFEDLPAMSLSGPTLSCDGRTLKLLRLAIQNLVNVQTLRIILGHHNITIGLLQGFFGQTRNCHRPVARLWLETCCLEGVLKPSVLDGYIAGLESVRIRRLRARGEYSDVSDTTELGRGCEEELRTAGDDERYRSYTISAIRVARSTAGYFRQANAWDDAIYSRFPEVEELVESVSELTNRAVETASQNKLNSIEEEPVRLVCQLVTSSSSTLRSLTLDWVLDGMLFIRNHWVSLLNFPNLRAFQVRNAIVKDTRFCPESVTSLLDGCWLAFLERHPQIQCLAWPLESFCSHLAPSASLSSKAKGVVAILGRNLKELRIDADIIFRGEPSTDQTRHNPWSPQFPGGSESRLRRHLFIEHVAPHLSTLEVLKIEGGIPFDERCEIVRAVRFSPLQKLVVIGVSFPPGDTWALLPPNFRQALLFDQVDIRDGMHTDNLEGLPTLSDNRDQWESLRSEALSAPFVPTYNPSRYSMLETVALCHAATIKSLKFCGFRGAPVLHSPTDLTSIVLAPLRHLHNLQHLTMAFCIPTLFEGSYRQEQIRSYWLDAQSSTSTALAMPADADVENAWAKILAERFAPAKLAKKVVNLLAPHLSRTAMARQGGMVIRALFLLGAHDIYELKVRMGSRGEVGSYMGPRAEYNAEKVREKLEKRAWF